MHFEVLVEDSSSAKLLEILLSRLLGVNGESHTWQLHQYKGCGHIPKELTKNTDPAKRVLLNRLPRLLRGYGNTPGIDVVVII